MNPIPERDDTPAWAILVPLVPFCVFLLLLGGTRLEDVVAWMAQLRTLSGWLGRFLWQPDQEGEAEAEETVAQEGWPA